MSYDPKEFPEFELRADEIDAAATHFLKTPYPIIRRFDTSISFRVVYDPYPAWFRLKYLPIRRLRIHLYKKLKAFWIKNHWSFR